MQVNATNLQYLFTQLETMYWQSYGTAAPWWSRIATLIPSSTEQNGYGWIGMLDKMRKWVGPRVEHEPAPQTYFAVNEPFELTESVDKFKIQDDTYGVYFPVVQFMGMNTAKWPDWELRDLIFNAGGQTGVKQYGLDQLAHWSAVHPIDFYDSSKGTYCNTFGTAGVSVGGVTVGGYLTPQGYATLWAEMASRKGENNEALGVLANLLACGPQLDITAKTILHAQFFSPQTYAASGMGTSVGPMENMLKGSSDILMIQDLAAYPTAWMLLDTTKPIKPFVWQLHTAPNFVYRINPQDPAVFNQHKFIYGSEARGTPAWSMAFLSSLSGV